VIGTSLPTTHWSLVRAAGSDETEESRRKALAGVLRTYFPAMRAHLLIKLRIPAGESEDLLQGFVADKVLEQEVLRAADQAKGRFRNFLLTALDRYVFDQHRWSGAKKRGGGETRVPIEEAALVAVAVGAGPDEAFDVAWARQVLTEAIQTMQEQCRAGARLDLWDVFESRVLASTLGGGRPIPYGELLARHSWKTPAQASNALVTAKRMFVRVLRSVIARYERDDADIDREIDDLHRLMSRLGS
jgi:hypothetical protein